MNSEHFKKHVMTLSRLQSPYLVRLLGYCADGDERLLVTEYMPKGSLRDQLHGNLHVEVDFLVVQAQVPDGLPCFMNVGSSILHRHALSWQRRLHVTYCVAQGLVHLHESVEPPVCHTDLESGNIMLDSSYNAKVNACMSFIVGVQASPDFSDIPTILIALPLLGSLWISA